MGKEGGEGVEAADHEGEKWKDGKEQRFGGKRSGPRKRGMGNEVRA